MAMENDDDCRVMIRSRVVIHLQSAVYLLRQVICNPKKEEKYVMHIYILDQPQNYTNF